METNAKCCRICGAEIPQERLEVIPDTMVCVKCSQKMGGEFELRVRVGGTGKPGSLKITGQEVSVKRQRRRLV
jgi:DksA/TraR C4-type zinc finger protein